LFCAVLVCLAGVMFESDRFKATDGAGSLRYMWQRDLVTFIVIFIVFASFVYLAIVMLNEITGYTPTWLTDRCQKKENAIMSAANTIQNQKDDHIEMSSFNPLAVHETPRPSVVGRLEAEATAMAKERVKLEEMIASQKQNEKALHKKNAGRGRKKPRRQNSNNRKKDFGAKVTELTLTDEELATIGTSSTSTSASALSAKNEKSKSKKGDSRNPTTGTLGKKKPSFRRLKTSENGREYFQNVESPNETTWIVPNGAEILTPESHSKNPYLGPKKQQSNNGLSSEGTLLLAGEETKNPTTGILGKKKQSFRRLKTSENGREYFENVDKPGETTWTVPADADVDE